MELECSTSRHVMSASRDTRKHYISNQQTRLIRKQDYLKNLHPGKEAELEDSETGSCSSTSSSAGDTDSNSETA